MLKNKKILLLGLLGLIIVLLFLILRPKKTPGIDLTNNPMGVGSSYQPELMSLEEKSQFNLPAESKIQVLKRDSGNQVEVYKIIRSEADLIYDLDSIKSIDPTN